MTDVSVFLTGGTWPEQRGAAPELEEAGYRALWIAGGQLDDLERPTEIVAATRQVPVGTAIVPVDVYDADAAAALAHAAGPRFVLGLGGAHGPHPVRTVSAYLDRLDAAGVPAGRRALAALGPRMLDLARERAAGAIIALADASFTASVRERIGSSTRLSVGLFAMLDPDRDRVRDAAREIIGFLAGVPAHRRHLVREGYTDAEIDGLDARLVDAFVPAGDADSVAARVAELGAAGADEVQLTVLGPEPLAAARELAVLARV